MEQFSVVDLAVAEVEVRAVARCREVVGIAQAWLQEGEAVAEKVGDGPGPDLNRFVELALEADAIAGLRASVATLRAALGGEGRAGEIEAFRAQGLDGKQRHLVGSV